MTRVVAIIVVPWDVSIIIIAQWKESPTIRGRWAAILMVLVRRTTICAGARSPSFVKRGSYVITTIKRVILVISEPSKAALVF